MTRCIVPAPRDYDSALTSARAAFCSPCLKPSNRQDQEAISFQLSTRSNKNTPASFLFSVRNTRWSPCTSTLVALTLLVGVTFQPDQKSLIRHETVCACKKKPDPSIKVRRRKVSVLLCWYTQTRLTRFLHASINHSEIGEVRRRACLQSRFESKPESEQ